MTLEIWVAIYLAMWVITSCDMWRRRPQLGHAPASTAEAIVAAVSIGAVWPALVVNILFRVVRRRFEVHGDN